VPSHGFDRWIWFREFEKRINMDTKNIVIVGGTRGLGFELAKEFALLGARIIVTGRHLADAEEAATKIASSVSVSSTVYGLEADITSFESLDKLKTDALAKLGSIDMLVVNAGINQPPVKVWESAKVDIDNVLAVDMRGPIYAAKVFLPPMMEKRRGALWFIEGLGSNNMMVDKYALYGTSKRGLAYFWRALAKEAKGTKVKICALSPGMMMTDFLMGNLELESEEQKKKTMRLYNILADTPETVARYAAPKMISNRRNGRLIMWLTKRKSFFRFLGSPFSKRDIVSSSQK
jgi:NAD(P)-dependent dehydrogenase (short-subunit alcohol dehydrogenase family)